MSASGGVGICSARERYGLRDGRGCARQPDHHLSGQPGLCLAEPGAGGAADRLRVVQASTGGDLPFAMPERSEPASQHQMQAFFDNLVRELDKVEFLRPREKRETMLVNLRNIFTRMDPTKQDMHTLHGVVMAIAEGRKGPAKGGVLDGEQATRLRALLAEHGQGPAVPGDSSTVRGLARLLRRNPTDAERILWQALTRDRRFAGQFKRQTPVGRHIPDFVSFVHRLAIELVNPNESDAIVADRAGRKTWLEARDYRVIEMRVADVERDLAAELERLGGEPARAQLGGLSGGRRCPRAHKGGRLTPAVQSNTRTGGVPWLHPTGVSKASGSRTATARSAARATSMLCRPTASARALVGMRITKGHFEETKLDGLIFAATVDFPGALHEGNGAAAADHRRARHAGAARGTLQDHVGQELGRRHAVPHLQPDRDEDA